MKRVFLCYRRSDRHAAGLLRGEVGHRLGRSRVFMDTSDIRAGDQFPDVIKSAVDRADVMLVLIGPGWLAEQERLDDPDDWVRREIEAALANQVRVVPVLLEDAGLPSEWVLPPEISDLATAHAYRIDSSHLDRDARDLLRALGLRRRPVAFVSAVAAVVVVSIVALLFWPSDDDDGLSFLNTEFVFDSSAAMGEVIPSDGAGAQKSKADVAEEQVRRYVETRDGDNLALRIAAGCGESGELVVPFGRGAGDDIVNSLAANSYTGSRFPLAAAVIAATGDFRDPDRFPADTVRKQIIVVTTGGSTCADDSASTLADRWDELGDIRLTMELIGLGVEKGSEEAEELQRTAAAVDGRAFLVESQEELDTVLRGLLEIEPVQQAAQEVSSLGNSIVSPLRDLRRAHNRCDVESAKTTTDEAEAAVAAAVPALESLEGRNDRGSFAAVHAAGEAWAESLAAVVDAGEELTDQIVGADGSEEACDELRGSEDWSAAVDVWNEAVGIANDALSDLDEQEEVLFDELQELLEN